MKTILAVDDSKAIRQMVTATLSSAGYELRDAANGALGLATASVQRFDLVISDVNMPELNGFEFVAALRRLPEYSGVPVLMLTTEFDQRQKAKARAAGANGWIIKPFDPDQLLSTVARVLA